MRMSNSSTSTTRRYLTLEEAKMLKDNKLVSGPTMEADIKSGLSSMLTRLERLIPRDLIRNSDSTETDHSTSDQECQ